MTNPPASSKWIVLAVAGSGVFMVTLDSGMVNVALPTLTRYFNESLATAQWTVVGYLLCVTGLLLPCGRLADMIGRKRVFLGGFVLFTIASALCGVAPSLGVLIAARVAQGIGGAMMQANSAGLVAQAFPPEQRGRALGLNGAIVSAGLLSGPVLGGLIIDWLDWRWLFFVNLPIGILATIFGLRQLREPARQPGQRFDLAGAALFFAFVVSLLLTLNWGGRGDWLAPAVLGLAAVTLVVGVVLALVERRAAQPMLEFRLFGNAGFRAATLAAFFSFLGVSHSQLLMPFYLQRVLGLAAAQVGVVLVTIPASILVLGPIAGILSDRFGSRLLASGGLLVAAGGLLSLTTLTTDSPVPAVMARLFLIAAGLAFFNSPNSSALFGSLPRERYGVGGAYQSLTRNLGQSVGQVMAAALWTAVVLTSAGVAVDAAPPAALMTGFQVAFTVAAAFSTVGAVISLLARPRAAPAATSASVPARPTADKPATRR